MTLMSESKSIMINRTIRLKKVLQTQAAQAALWKIVSCTCFAAICGFVHALTRFSVPLPPGEVAFFQTGLAAFFLWIFAVCRASKGSKGVTFTLEQPLLTLARAFCLAIGVSLWFTALKYLPLADIAAFKLLSPLIVILGACLFLKERLSPQRLFALSACLIGAGLLFQKEFSKGWQGDAPQASWAILLPLVALVAYAASNLLAKRLLKKDNPQNVTFSLLVLSTPLLGFFAAFDWVTPSLFHVPFLATMGVLSGLAYYALNKALHYGDLTYLMPFGLTRFVASALIACGIFGESLSLPLLSGALLIMLISFWLVRTEAKQELSTSLSFASKA